MKSKSLVSVIINCRNSEKYIFQSINSVINQTYIFFELIVVNNNSTDNTKKIIFSFDDNRIKYIELSKKKSLGAARNVALKKCKGDYIAFLDSDDQWMETKLEKTINNFSDDIGLVFSDVIYFNSKKSFNLYDARKPYTGNCFEDLILDYNLCISSCVVSKEKITNLNFDENLNVCEDLEFFLRLAYVSKLKYIPETLVKYRIHDSNLSITNQDKFYDEFYIVLNNLSGLNIDDKVLKRIIDVNFINYAKFYWKNRKINKAYMELNKIKNLYFQVLIYKLIMLIPYKLVNKIYRIISPVKIGFD